MHHYFFAVPALQPGGAQQEFNEFCTANRVVSIDRQFVSAGADSYWALCLVVAQGPKPLPDALKVAGRKSGILPGKIDYRAVLNDADFALFAALRRWRKSMAEQEGVPVYAVFTNEQLAEIAQRRVGSLGALGEIPGIGPARVERYGAKVLTIVEAEPALAGGG